MKILAVASGGGHWIELLRLTPFFELHDTTYTTVNATYADDVDGQPFCEVKDATSWTPWATVVLACQILVIVLSRRPDVVITTGAAPGLFALVFGRLIRARTIWLDSIANVDELSRSGRMARRFADLWLTQWPHLAGESGPEYAGSVL